MVKLKNHILLVLILLGLVLRLYGLGWHSLWFDEASSIFKALPGYSLFDLIRFKYLLAMAELPLFSIILHFWARLGDSEFILRLLPLIFSVSSIFLIYKIGELIFNIKTGLIAAFILAISPFSIYYAQELRTYSLNIFLALLSVYYLVQSLNQDKFKFWIGFIIINIFCFYAHYTMIFFIVAEYIYIFLYYKKSKNILNKCLLSSTIIFFGVLFPLFLSFKQIILLKKAELFFWIPAPSLKLVLNTFKFLNLGYNAGIAVQLYGLIAFFLIFIFAVYKAFKAKKDIRLLLIWLFFPISMVIFISKISGSIYLFRSFCYVSAAYYLLIAYGLSYLRKRYLAYILSIVLMLCAASLVNYYKDIWPDLDILTKQAIFVKKDNRAAAEYVKGKFEEGDVIFHTCRSTLFPFQYYHKRKFSQRWVIYASDEDSIRWNQFFGSLGQDYDWLKNFAFDATAIDIRDAARGKRRIWLVFSWWENEFNDNNEKIKKWLDNNYNRLGEEEFNGLKVYLYDGQREG